MQAEAPSHSERAHRDPSCRLASAFQPLVRHRRKRPLLARLSIPRFVPSHVSTACPAIDFGSLCSAGRSPVCWTSAKDCTARATISNRKDSACPSRSPGVCFRAPSAPRSVDELWTGRRQRRRDRCRRSLTPVRSLRAWRSSFAPLLRALDTALCLSVALWSPRGLFRMGGIYLTPGYLTPAERPLDGARCRSSSVPTLLLIDSRLKPAATAGAPSRRRRPAQISASFSARSHATWASSSSAFARSFGVASASASISLAIPSTAAQSPPGSAYWAVDAEPEPEPPPHGARAS
jgi:hypothetical protein